MEPGQYLELDAVAYRVSKSLRAASALSPDTCMRMTQALLDYLGLMDIGEKVRCEALEASRDLWRRRVAEAELIPSLDRDTRSVVMGYLAPTGGPVSSHHEDEGRNAK